LQTFLKWKLAPIQADNAKILGGAMVTTHAGDMISEIARAIEMGAYAVAIGIDANAVSIAAGAD